jgi:Amidase
LVSIVFDRYVIFLTTVFYLLFVFNTLLVLIGICAKDTSAISSSIKKTYNIKFVFTSPATPLPSGPYFLSPLTGNVYQAYRLYTDENQAFIYGVVPASNGTYKQLSAHTDGAHTPTVGVPSRLYYTPTPAQPLAGYRLAVKDIYDVAGLKTGCGSRAYYQTYPIKNTTALSVQRLVDAGMVIIGKVKTSQYANAERITDDWVDYHASYNARGDGYQDTNSSSTGSGSAMSSYDWVDFALGSDTGGSMRGPAGKCGLYGNRPSRGAIPLTNVMPLSPTFDTAGIFSRDAILWAQVGKLWYTDFQDYTTYPKKLLFPVDGFGSSYTANPPANGTADATLNSFLKKVEGFLGVNRTEVNLNTMWAGTRPTNVSATSFNDLLNTSFQDILGPDSIRLVGNSFIQDYAAMNGGRTPFINPSPYTLWAYGRTVSPSRYQQAIANKTIFQNWVATQILRGNQSNTCSDAILVYPQSVGTTAYRNLYLP